MGEEADLLWDAVFDDSEVFLGEAGDDAAVGIVDTEGGVDEVSFDLDVWDALSQGRFGQ